MSGRLLRHWVTRGREPAAPAGFRRTRVMVVDVEDPPALTGAAADDARPYDAAWVLARQGGRPLGLLEVDLGEEPLTGSALVAMVHARWPDGASEPLKPGTVAVTVVIPTFRRPDDVLRCVRSVLATGYPDLEVLVVDNAPADPTTATAIAQAFAGDARVCYLAEPQPGASRARNRGVREARGEVIAFVDDDILVDARWLDALSAAFEQHPDVGCVTGLVLPATVDTPVHAWFEAYGGFDRGYRPRRFDLEDNRGDTLLYPYTAGALGGLGNAAFRRELLTRRPFDETLGPGTPAFGAEDQDALLHVIRSGGTLLYEPAAVVHHRHRDTYADLRWQVFTYGAGFVAALLHWSLHDRSVARELLRRVPRILPLAFSRSTPEPAATSATDVPLPPELHRLGQLGYLYGPVAYVRAVLAHRRLQRRAAA